MNTALRAGLVGIVAILTTGALNRLEAVDRDWTLLASLLVAFLAGNVAGRIEQAEEGWTPPPDETDIAPDDPGAGQEG